MEPAAREAGDVYGGFKSAIAEVIKKLLEFIGVKAASDAALGNTQGIKKATDAYILLRIALATFAAFASGMFVTIVTATTLISGLGVAVAGLGLAVGSALVFGGVAAAAVAAVAAVGIYVFHLQKATEARLAYLNGGQELINGLQKEQNAMVSAADRAKVLANAYAILKKAREDAASATSKGQKNDAQALAGAAQTEIGKMESYATDLVRLRERVREQINEAKTLEERVPLLSVA